MVLRPSSSTGSAAAAVSAGAPSDASVDAGFARDMSIHHQQAFEMPFIVRDRTSDMAARQLAYDICWRPVQSYADA
ncbi:DUF305 domain-containing protein [Streptomyces sp. NPDC058439]|uniref:DUF305 domain-containing protein n=1 Tax=Streptomyces sp. NPDC058439 TaxID=3346500 RepID=UPI003658CCA2